jgi:fatty-acyl-CoA synthase
MSGGAARWDGVVPFEVEMVSFCREHLVHYKCPCRVVFAEELKTASGKIRKFRLRGQAGNKEAVTSPST